MLRQRFCPSGEVSRQNRASFDNLVHVPDQPIHMHMEILAYELTSESDPEPDVRLTRGAGRLLRNHETPKVSRSGLNLATCSPADYDRLRTNRQALRQ